MRKNFVSLSVITLFALSLTMMGCGKQEEPAPPPPPPAPAAPAEPAPPATPSEPAKDAAGVLGVGDARVGIAAVEGEDVVLGE